MPQNKIRNRPSGGEILFSVPILTTVVLRGPSMVSLYKISRKLLKTRLSYCDSTFSIHTFEPIYIADGTLTQWHHVILPVVYLFPDTVYNDTTYGEVTPLSIWYTLKPRSNKKFWWAIAWDLSQGDKMTTWRSAMVSRAQAIYTSQQHCKIAYV